MGFLIMKEEARDFLLIDLSKELFLISNYSNDWF